MKRFDALIWDLDGTLLDTLDDLTDSVNYALAAHSMAQRTRSEIRSFVGNGIRNLMALSVPGGADTPEFDSVFVCFKTHYASNCRNKTKPYEGIAELLCELSADGYKLAVVSNKADFAVKELVHHFFGDSVAVAIGEKSGTRRKPCPDSVLEALGELQVSSDRAVYIGDSDVDIKTAKNAGLPCISVSWGFRDREQLISAGAQAIADSPGDIHAMI